MPGNAGQKKGEEESDGLCAACNLIRMDIKKKVQNKQCQLCWSFLKGTGLFLCSA